MIKLIWKLFGWKESQPSVNKTERKEKVEQSLMQRLHIEIEATVKLFNSHESDKFFLFEEQYWHAMDELNRLLVITAKEQSLETINTNAVAEVYNRFMSALKTTYADEGNRAMLKRIANRVKPILQEIKKAQ